MNNRVKVWTYFGGLNITTNNIALDGEVQFSLQSTILDGRTVGRTEKLGIEPAQPNWGRGLGWAWQYEFDFSDQPTESRTEL